MANNPSKGKSRGRGQGRPIGHGGPIGHRGGNKRDGQSGDIGQHRDASPADGDRLHGRSESSPGHLKKAAGAQNARDYAPGRTATMDREPSLPDVAPDELGEEARGERDRG